MSSDRAQLRQLKFHNVDSQHPGGPDGPCGYNYEDWLFGVWNKKYPNLYYVGTTRPQTGAFASSAEIENMLVYKLITDVGFKTKMDQEFDGHMSSWKHDVLEHPKTVIKEADYSGQLCYRIGGVLGIRFTLWHAMTQGFKDALNERNPFALIDLVYAYFAGADNILRYTLQGDFYRKESKAKYLKILRTYQRNEAKRTMFEIMFPHIFFLNIFLLVFQAYGMWACIFWAAAGCIPVEGRFLYHTWEKAFRVATVPWISFCAPEYALRMLWPCVLLFTAYRTNQVLFVVLACLSVPFYLNETFMPSPLGDFMFFFTESIIASVSFGVCYWIAQQLDGKPQYSPFSVIACILIYSGIVPGFIACLVDGCLAWDARGVFNDCRPKKKPEFVDKFKQYLADVKTHKAKKVS
jgi:hypothetical protein